MSEQVRDKFNPFFDQQDPEREIAGMVASDDNSQPYELDAIAVFAVVPSGFLVVEVSGCSCWPDRVARLRRTARTASALLAS